MINIKSNLFGLNKVGSNLCQLADLVEALGLDLEVKHGLNYSLTWQFVHCDM